MLSSISQLFSMRSQAKSLKAQAQIMEENARGTRKAANAQAAYIEQTARQNQSIAGENLMRARTNQRAAVATAENNRAASGLSGGTTEQPAASLRQTLDLELANLAQSASIASINAWQGALDTRRKGEIEAYKKEAQADQYRRVAKSIRTSMLISGISSAVGTIAGAISGYRNANSAIGADMNSLHKEYTAGNLTESQYLQQRETLLNQANTRVALGTLTSASQTGAAAFDIANTFNPYTAALDANPSLRKNNYGGAWSVLMGNIPYSPTRADSLYQQFI